MADDHGGAFAGELIGHRIGGLGVALVVHRLQRQRTAIDAAGLVDVGDRLRCTLLHLAAEDGEAA